MAIYEIKDSRIVKVEETSFSDEGIKECEDLQRLIRGREIGDVREILTLGRSRAFQKRW
jgi:hypothetical protein